MHHEVLRLKALMPHLSCRKLADTFNAIYGPRRAMTVGKTFVGTVLKKNSYRIAEIWRSIRNRKPGAGPVNRLWALDLTYLPDQAEVGPVLGILDHGSRACVALRNLRSKSSIMILRTLLDAIDCFGLPKIIRTDNEACFTSATFRFGLAWLGIRRQTTELRAPWQNGRVERLFATLKGAIRLRAEPLLEIDRDLRLLRNWYNHLRPHQHLNGRTPAQVWSGEGPSLKTPRFLSAWEGVLSSYYIPP